MLKKINKSVMFLSAFLITSAMADSSGNLRDLTQMQNFYYEKGYADASEKFYKSGYEQAVFDMVRQMQKYKNVIDSYEAGKYYLSTNKITFPRIFRTRDANGQYVIQIDTPEIQEKLTLEDIFILPELDNNSQNSFGSFTHSSSIGGRMGGAYDIHNPVYTANANAIHPVRTNTSRVDSPISVIREFGVNFPKTDRLRRILEAGGVKFVEMPNQYKAYFRNENDYNTFCKNVSGDTSCSNLLQQR